MHCSKTHYVRTKIKENWQRRQQQKPEHLWKGKIKEAMTEVRKQHVQLINIKAKNGDKTTHKQ